MRLLLISADGECTFQSTGQLMPSRQYSSAAGAEASHGGSTGCSSSKLCPIIGGWPSAARPRESAPPPELGDDQDGAVEPAGGHGLGQLRPIVALAALDLDVLADELPGAAR